MQGSENIGCPVCNSARRAKRGDSPEELCGELAGALASLLNADAMVSCQKGVLAACNCVPCAEHEAAEVLRRYKAARARMSV